MSDPRWQGCVIPPAGWWCSREEGHDGPCAARPASGIEGEAGDPKGLHPEGESPAPKGDAQCR